MRQIRQFKSLCSREAVLPFSVLIIKGQVEVGILYNSGRIEDTIWDVVRNQRTHSFQFVTGWAVDRIEIELHGLFEYILEGFFVFFDVLSCIGVQLFS